MIVEIITETFVALYQNIYNIITKMLPVILIIALVFTLTNAYTDIKILFNVSSLRDFF